jgi:hypothetical protein
VFEPPFDVLEPGVEDFFDAARFCGLLPITDIM